MTADLLSDLLKLFSDEDLIRLVRRAKIHAMPAVAELLSSEYESREDYSAATHEQKHDVEPY